jgi:hypothetical protein
MEANYKIYNNYVVELRYFPLDRTKSILEINDTSITLGNWGIANGEIVELPQLDEATLQQYIMKSAKQDYE